MKVLPLTSARWADFETLFGPNGACAGCWCLWCRLPKKEYAEKRGAKAKAMMRQMVSQQVPGLLAYDGRAAVGWCAVGPREEFSRLKTSRILKPIDDKPVWSVPCLFIAKSHRGQGVSVALLKAAVAHAKKQGAKIVEGYPVVPGKRQADAFLWWGVASAFSKAGFKVVAEPSASRRIMRHN